jgi:hypothetical protein
MDMDMDMDIQYSAVCDDERFGAARETDEKNL